MSNDKNGETGKVISHYSGVSHDKGPAIYTRADMYDAIFELGEIRDLPRDEPSRFGDLMSGVKCLVASEVKERAEKEGIPIEIYCLDIAFAGLEEGKVRELENNGYILSDVDITKGTGYDSLFFHRAAERFGIKNYDRETQEIILEDIKRAMKPGGIFTVIDMVSPEKSYEWMQTERKRKSRHTIGEENAHHHIPTLGMWFEMLKKTGFEPNTNVYQTHSYVKTQDWVNSNQMGQNGLDDMNDFLLSAPEQTRKDFNVRQDGGLVRIDYPVSVIAARSI